VSGNVVFQGFKEDCAVWIWTLTKPLDSVKHAEHQMKTDVVQSPEYRLESIESLALDARDCG
jgi:hypothetical protein